VPPDVPQFFLPRRGQLAAGTALEYRPALLGAARLHYADKKAGIDHWETLCLIRPIGEEVPADVWDGATVHGDCIPELDKAPEAGASFAPLPAALTRGKSYAEWTKALKNYLYRDWKLTIWSCPDLKAYSRPRETQRDFRLRLAQGSREERDRALEALRARYAAKRDRLQKEVRRARERLDREQAQASQSTFDAAISFGNSVLGAFLGRRTITKTNVGKAASAAKAAGRAMQQRGDVGKAQADLDAALEKFTNLELQIQQEVEHIQATRSPELLKVVPIELTPKKTDITIEQVVLAWTPWKVDAGGQAEAAY
jgi:hypothetical protein